MALTDGPVLLEAIDGKGLLKDCTLKLSALKLRM